MQTPNVLIFGSILVKINILKLTSKKMQLNTAENHQYETVLTALNQLNAEGYTSNFNLRATHLEDTALQLKLYPDDFEVKKIFRFEGESDPGDSSIVYAIESKSGSVKGVLINAYGAYADTVSSEIIAKLNYNPKNI